MSAPLDYSGAFQSRYFFRELAIGEEVVIGPERATESQVRTAATQMGTRYGVWLQARKCPEGIRVTRVESAPAHTKKKWKATLHRERTQAAQMKTLTEALRCLTVLVCEIRETVSGIREVLEK